MDMLTQRLLFVSGKFSLGAWCSGITSASHAEGPGFKSQCVRFDPPTHFPGHGFRRTLMAWDSPNPSKFFQIHGLGHSKVIEILSNPWPGTFQIQRNSSKSGPGHPKSMEILPNPCILRCLAAQGGGDITHPPCHTCEKARISVSCLMV